MRALAAWGGCLKSLPWHFAKWPPLETGKDLVSRCCFPFSVAIELTQGELGTLIKQSFLSVTVYPFLQVSLNDLLTYLIDRLN